MADKQKVTLYLSDELHRQFKIRSAVDGETMSSMAQRAIEFYLSNSETVEASAESYGQTHRVHSCPQCSATVTLGEEGLALIPERSGHLLSGVDDLKRLSNLVSEGSPSALSAQGSECEGAYAGDSKRPDEGELISC